MARSAASMAVIFMVSFLLVSCFLHEARATITCGQVGSAVGPCIPYLRGNGDNPPSACCSGLSKLNSAAQTTTDRQAACNCLKQLLTRISRVNYRLAAGLPLKCRVSIPYPISPSTNCSKVQGAVSSLDDTALLDLLVGSFANN